MQKFIVLFILLVFFSSRGFAQEFEMQTFAKVGIKRVFNYDFEESFQALHLGVQQQIQFLDIEAHIDVPIFTRFTRLYSTSGENLNVNYFGESYLSGGITMGFHLTHKDAKLGFGGGYAVHIVRRPIGYIQNSKGIRSYQPLFTNNNERVTGPSFYLNYSRNFFQVEVKYDLLRERFNSALFSIQTNILLNKELIKDQPSYDHPRARIEFNLGLSSRLSYYPFLTKFSSVQGEVVYQLKNDWGFGYSIEKLFNEFVGFQNLRQIYFDDNLGQYSIPSKSELITDHVRHLLFLQKSKFIRNKNKWFYGMGVGFQRTTIATLNAADKTIIDFTFIPMVGIDIGPIKNTLSMSIPTGYGENFYFNFTTAVSLKLFRFQKWEEI